MAGALGGGFTEGMLGTQLDLQNIQMGQYKLAEAPIKLQQEQIQLQKDKIGLAQQMRTLSLMQNMRLPEGTGPDAMADLMNQMSVIQMASGNPEEARKLAYSASQIMEDASKVDSRSYRMQNDRLSRIANVMQGYPDSAAGFSGAVQDLVASDPSLLQNKTFVSMVQYYSQRPWEAGTMDKIVRGVTTAKDQATIDYKRRELEHLEALDKAIPHRTALEDAEADHARESAIKLKKEQGEGAPVKAQDVQLILSMAGEKFPGADRKDLYYRAYTVAGEINTVVANEHVTRAEAAHRVFDRSLGAEGGARWQGLKIARVHAGTGPSNPFPTPGKDEKAKPNMWTQFDEPRWLSPVDGQAYSESELAAKSQQELDEIGYEGE